MGNRFRFFNHIAFSDETCYVEMLDSKSTFYDVGSKTIQIEV